jgi:hypothetical protein
LIPIVPIRTEAGEQIRHGQGIYTQITMSATSDVIQSNNLPV